jgi:hypothetical protein
MAQEDVDTSAAVKDTVEQQQGPSVGQKRPAPSQASPEEENITKPADEGKP